jgi:hypothetical protein
VEQQHGITLSADGDVVFGVADDHPLTMELGPSS